MSTAKKPFALSKETMDIERLGMLKAEIAILTAEHDKIESRLRRKLGRRVGLHYAFTAFDGMAKTFNYVRAKRLIGAAEFYKCWKEVGYRSSRLTSLKQKD